MSGSLADWDVEVMGGRGQGQSELSDSPTIGFCCTLEPLLWGNGLAALLGTPEDGCFYVHQSIEVAQRHQGLDCIPLLGQLVSSSLELIFG